MTKISDLVTKLSGDLKAVKPLAKPYKIIFCVLSALLIYAALVQIFLGLRDDFILQLTRPIFAAEILLVLFLFLSSAVAAVLTMYPDFYQKSRLLKIPYLVFFVLIGFFITQFFAAQNIMNLISQESFRAAICTIHILFFAVIPTIFIFIILQKGATVFPLQSGLFTVLTASSLGYLIMRLHENNDSVIHLFVWHYLPILFFALLGTLVGKLLLRW